MNTVLITGGAGFVGIPTVQQFLNSGADVTVLDSFGVAPITRRETLTKLGARVEVADLRDADAVNAIVKQVQPTMVIHLAAIHFIPYCIAHPAEALAVNVLGTQHVLDAVANAQCVEVFQFASTADVYRPDLAAHHEMSIIGSDNVYGQSKMIGEELVAIRQRQGAFERSVITRFFNVVGPGETNAHLVPDILDYLELGDALPLGSTDTKRDYVYVGDVANAVHSLVTTDHGPSVTVNVGTGSSYSAIDIVEALATITDRPLRVQTDPAKVRRSDRPNLQADITALQALLPGFTPTPLTVSLAEALAQRSLESRDLAA